MREINQVLGQVPPAIKDQGSPRQKLEAIWRVMAIHRNGLQTRVAADVADSWAGANQPPRLPVDDPRAAAKRIEKALNGEAGLSLDFSHALIAAFPPAYRAAAKVLVFPSGPGPAEQGGLMSALQLDAENDSVTDRARFELARCGGESMTPEQLEVIALSYEKGAAHHAQVAREARALAASKRLGVA